MTTCYTLGELGRGEPREVCINLVNYKGILLTFGLGGGSADGCAGRGTKAPQGRAVI